MVLAEAPQPPEASEQAPVPGRPGWPERKVAMSYLARQVGEALAHPSYLQGVAARTRTSGKPEGAMPLQALLR
jgi:hypothetical protein